MYISRVELDVNNIGKIRNLTHVGAFHDWVEKGFPKEIEGNVRTRKLWRVDSLNEKTYLIVVSSKVPDTKMLERYGVEGSVETKCYDNFLNSLKKGMKMRFRVVLNPVVSKKNDENSRRGRIVPCLKIEEQKQYLLDRSEKNGFLLLPEDIVITERTSVKLYKKNFDRVDMVKVSYEGVLTIADIEKFREILTTGLGKHKAYGFGLMTVMPLE